MMRTGVFALGALSLINLAAAQPSGLHRRHQQLHEKRQDVEVVVETDYSYVTTQLPDVVIYVDENGNPYSTSTVGVASATSAASSVASVSTQAAVTTAAASSSTTLSSVYVAPTTSSSIVNKVADVTTSKAASTTSKAAATTSAAATTDVSVSVSLSSGSSTTSSSSSAAASSSSSGTGPTGYGIVYSPYSSSGGCKDQDTINTEFASINSYAESNGDDWSFVRIYGTDCSQVEYVLSAAAEYDLEIFAGVYDITSNSSVDAALEIIINAANGDWSRFQTIAIGNEVVNSGTLTVEEVGERVAYARSQLGAADYTGNIVAVDTLVATVANSGLCDISDYVAVNSHPFFDGSVAAADSGPWLLEQMERVSSVCDGKNVMITETGWPTQGDTNGDAVPSAENQASALSSIKSSISSKVVFLSAFNELWKTNSASTFNAEKYWGICDS